MCNALTVTKRESAPLPERLCERIAYCAILLTVYEADYSVVVAQSEGADHRYYSTPEMQNILLQNVVVHTVRKAKNFAGGATDAILSGRQVLINLMSDFVLDKTKATAKRSPVGIMENKRITNNARFAAGGQSVTGEKFRLFTVIYEPFLCDFSLIFSRYANDGRPLFLVACPDKKSSSKKSHLVCAGEFILFCGSSFGMVSLCLTYLRLSSSHYGAGGQNYQSDSVSCQACSDCFFMCSLRNFSRAKAHGANLSDSDSCATFVRCFLRAGEGVFVNSLSFMVHTCIAMCRSSSHHGAGRFYPLGSIPRCCNSLRIIRFIQAARESSPSCCCAFSIFSRKSGSKRNWNGGLPRLSFLCVDTLITPHVMYLCVMTHYTQSAQKAKPRTVGAVTGLLTTNDSKIIEVAMLNHTTHPQGRDSHNLNKYIWRFIALSTAQPRVITIEATSEQEARQKNQLIATVSQGYDSRTPYKTGVGIRTPLEIKAIHDAPASFFVSAHTHTYTMVGCMGPTSVGLVSFIASSPNPVQSTASELRTSGGGYIPTIKEAAIMATTPTLVHSQTAFIWRFIIFGASESQIIHVTAWTEREARNRCPSGCVAVFAARIRQGVCHVQ